MFKQFIFMFNRQELSIKTADANGSTVILATDPDADRLALAEKQPEYVTALLIEQTWIVCVDQNTCIPNSQFY